MCTKCNNEIKSDEMEWVPIGPVQVKPSCPICLSKELEKISTSSFRCIKCSVEFRNNEVVWTTEEEEEEIDDDKEDETEEIFHCRMCANEVKHDDEECTNCGEESPGLTIKELEKERNDRVKEKYSIHCFRCGQVNYPGVKRCRVCQWEFPDDYEKIGYLSGSQRTKPPVDDPTPDYTYIGNCAVCGSSMTAGDMRNSGCQVCRNRERESLMIGPACPQCKELITLADVQSKSCPLCGAQFDLEVQPEWICPDCQGRGCVHCDQSGAVTALGLVDPDGNDDDDEGKNRVRIRT